MTRPIHPQIWYARGSDVKLAARPATSLLASGPGLLPRQAHRVEGADLVPNQGFP